MRLSYILILLGSIFFFSCSEKTKKPSTSADLISTYLKEGKYEENSFEIRAKNLERAYESLVSNPDSVNVNLLYDVANESFTIRDISNFGKVSRFLLSYAIAKKDTVEVAKSYTYLAEYYKINSQTDSAFYAYLQAEKLYKSLGDSYNLGKVYLKKGTVHFHENDYLSADISISQAYNLLRRTNDSENLYKVTSMMGVLATEMKEYSRAIDKHSEALILAEEMPQFARLHYVETSLNNLGNVYQNLKDHQQAIKYFQRGLATGKTLSEEMPELYSNLVDNLAYSKLKIGEFDDLSRLFNEALDIRINNKLSHQKIISIIHLSEYYATIGDTAKSIELAQQATEFASQNQAPSYKLLALKQLSVLKPENSSDYTKEYIRINDSLLQAERTSQNKLARIQFETEELMQQKDQLAKKNQNLLYAITLIVFIVILLFVIRIQRAKNRDLNLKHAQQKANEDVYNMMISQQNRIEQGRIQEKNRIARELHDGILGRLFGIRLNLDSLNKKDGESAIDRRNQYLFELKNIEQDIREISHDLSRERFVLINNFSAILNNFVLEQKSTFTTQINAKIDRKIEWISIDNTLKVNLFRIVQESVRNAQIYSKANKILICVEQDENLILLSVSDDGIGFNPNEKRKGIGIRNMEARAKELDAELFLKSQIGEGTKIQVNFLIKKKAVN